MPCYTEVTKVYKYCFSEGCILNGTLTIIMPSNKLPMNSLHYPKKHASPLDIFYPLTDEIYML